MDALVHSEIDSDLAFPFFFIVTCSQRERKTALTPEPTHIGFLRICYYEKDNEMPPKEDMDSMGDPALAKDLGGEVDFPPHVAVQSISRSRPSVSKFTKGTKATPTDPRKRFKSIEFITSYGLP